MVGIHVKRTKKRECRDCFFFGLGFRGENLSCGMESARVPSRDARPLPMEHLTERYNQHPHGPPLLRPVRSCRAFGFSRPCRDILSAECSSDSNRGTSEEGSGKASEVILP
jgi:hypothetical protein